MCRPWIQNCIGQTLGETNTNRMISITNTYLTLHRMLDLFQFCCLFSALHSFWIPCDFIIFCYATCTPSQMCHKTLPRFPTETFCIIFHVISTAQNPNQQQFKSIIVCQMWNRFLLRNRTEWEIKTAKIRFQYTEWMSWTLPVLVGSI